MNLSEKLGALPTPCYVIDEEALIHNLEILQRMEKETGCHVLLAQKAFSNYKTYPLISKYISGTTASGIFEAKLAHEEMPGSQVHVFSPAYKDEDMDGLLDICLVKSMSKVKLLAAVAAVYFKLHTLFRNITCHRAKKVKIVTKVPQQLHIDGETPAKVRLAEFECAGKLRILK